MMPRLHRRDIISILVLGEIVGAFGYAIVRVQKFDVLLTKFIPSAILPALFIIGVPIAALVALAVAAFIGKKIPAVFQVAKFIAVGFSNTMVDWGILNLLLAPLGLGTASYVGGKSISFAAATFSSYFWNKTWTFESREFKGAGKQAAQFFLVTAVGLFINVGTATFLKSIGPGTKLWAGILAPGFATILSGVWDFAAYRFIVFKRASVAPAPEPKK